MKAENKCEHCGAWNGTHSPICKVLDTPFPMQPDFGLDISQYKAHLEKILKEQPGVTDSSVTKCAKLWDTMPFKEKTVWFFYNVLFPSKGVRKREQISAAHLELAHAWKLDNPEAGWDECPYVLEYPNVLQPFPKSIIVVESILKLSAPLEYIQVDLEITNEHK